MGFSEYADYDGIGLAELVRKGEVTPIELVEACVERIEKHNHTLNAVIYRMDQLAREVSQRALPDGPFKGVPFLLKDILATYKGVPTTSGSRALKNLVFPVDSELVARYKRAGLIAVGKTNASEFGLVSVTEPILYGPTHNPWDTERTPGGSSGGSAAAVAAGIVPFAHGNDGGGSIRIPAACCGLVGLKPTRARNPLGPLFGDLLNGFVCEHVLTRTVRDSAAVLDATAGPDIGDPYWAPPPKGRFIDATCNDPGQLLIAYTTTDSAGETLHLDAVAAANRAASLCESLGHKVEEYTPQSNPEEIRRAFAKVWCSGAANSVDSYAAMLGIAPSEEVFEPLTLAMAEEGRTVSASDYLGAIFILQMFSREIARTFEKFDIWLAPTLGEPPLKTGTIDIRSRDIKKQFSIMEKFQPYTAIFNATGQPAVSLPLYWTKEKLPLGVQFAGRFGAEETLLSLAAQLERAAPWKDKHPPIWG
jgi:amidase